MTILGLSAGFHDASATIIDSNGNILFAAHSERYSRVKNDANIHPVLEQELLTYGIDHIAYYETPWLKQSRRLYSGEGVQWNCLTTYGCIRRQVPNVVLANLQLAGTEFSNISMSSYRHHLSHAAAGFQTSPYDKATVVVIDAIGEWDTITIWAASYDCDGRAQYKKLWSQKYPHSIGLFYSAMTENVGLKPNEDEYILMGMSAYGEMGFGELLRSKCVEDSWEVEFKDNLHLGVQGLEYIGDIDIAAGAQDLTEDLIASVMKRAQMFNWSNNLVYTGGVALNCLANRKLGLYFDNIWIMPNPGDSGSSLGAAALAYGKKLNWVSPYLGYDIAGPYPVNALLDELITNQIVGVASGRAEFGPRALGNRSLLADPRGNDIKDRVNAIKQRQQFRPFAPVILEEFADQYFDMPVGWKTSPYMQVTANCKYPEQFPAIVHADGSSRVQTVGKDCGSGIRELLEKWYLWTGCPMLLNTSLNIKGEPIVNDGTDAVRFQNKYGVKVLS